MHRIWKPLLLSFALFCVYAAYVAYRQMSPWFWIFAASALLSMMFTMSLRWALHTIVWFGVFYLVRWQTGNGLVAFLAASIASQLSRILFAFTPIGRRRFAR